MNFYNLTTSGLTQSFASMDPIIQMNQYLKNITFDMSGGMSNNLLGNSYASNAWQLQDSFLIGKYGNNVATITNFASSSFSIYTKYSCRLNTLPIFDHYGILISSNVIPFGGLGGSVIVSFYSMNPLILYPYTISNVQSTDICGTPLSGHFLGPFQQLTLNVSSTLSIGNSFFITCGNSFQIQIINSLIGSFQFGYSDSTYSSNSNVLNLANNENVVCTLGLDTKWNVSNGLWNYTTNSMINGDPYPLKISFPNPLLTSSFSGLTVSFTYVKKVSSNGQNDFFAAIACPSTYTINDGRNLFLIREQQDQFMLYSISTSIPTLTIDTSYKICITFQPLSSSSFTTKLYLNGSQLVLNYPTVNAYSYILTDASWNLIFGTSNSTYHALPMSIGNIKIYNTVLSDTLVAQL